MAESFDMVGRLFLGKETDKFKPYEEREFNSGWQNRTLKFNCSTGNSVHFLQIQGGRYKDGSNRVYFYDKEKKERTFVSFTDRKVADVVERAAEWNKFVIDLFDKPRYLIDKVLKKNEINDDEKKILGVDSVEEVKALKEKAIKLRKEYLSEWDFAKVVKDVLSKPEYKDKKFKVKGTIEHSYFNGKHYPALKVQKIYLANDDAEEKATANLHFLYSKESLDDEWTDGKFKINGWLPYYDSASKKTQFAPFTLTIKASNDSDQEKAKRIDAIRIKRFKAESSEDVYEYGVIANIINGAETRKITEEDLTEEQQDALYCGDITMEDIQRELGDVVGDRIHEYQFEKLLAGYSTGPKETTYKVDDMRYQVNEDDDDDSLSYELEDDDDDLFEVD